MPRDSQRSTDSRGLSPGGPRQLKALGRTATTLTRETSFYHGSETEGSVSRSDGSESPRGTPRGSAHGSSRGSRPSDGEYSETDYTGSESEYTDYTYSDSQASYTDDSRYDDEYTEEEPSGSEYHSEDDYYTDESPGGPRQSVESSQAYRPSGGFLPPLGGHQSSREPFVPGAAAQPARKNVVVYRNGDAYFPGRQVAVGPSFRSYEAFLDDLTHRIRSPFGAVRRLYKLPGGKLVHGLDDIEDGDLLVASRVERFQALPYETIVDHKTRQRTYVRPDLDKIKYKPREVKGRNKVDHAITLYCLGNGDKDGILTQIVLKPRDLSSFEHVLDLITEKLGYKKLLCAAQKLIDLETKEHVSSLQQLHNNHIYVAIDRPDHIVMPPFRVDKETRELIPVVKRSSQRVKNMPIMFEDDVIHGKINSGPKILDRRRQRTGVDSNVGKVTFGKRPMRRPNELPPIKQPFQVAHPHDMSSFRKANVQNTPQDKATWRIVNSLIDDETSGVVEEVLYELEHDLMALLERYIDSKGKKADRERHDRRARRDGGSQSRRESKRGSTRRPAETRGSRGDSQESRRSSRRESKTSQRGGRPARQTVTETTAVTTAPATALEHESTTTSRRSTLATKVESAGAAEVIQTSAAAPVAAAPTAPLPTQEPVASEAVASTPPAVDEEHRYDGDVDRFLEYMAHPTTDVFRRCDTTDEQDLHDRLVGAMKAAMAGRLSHWEHMSSSAVALVILLDQIPRRVYQGHPDMYSGDDKCKDVIFRLARTNQSLLQQIKPTTLLFVCIALSHQEDREAQSMAQQIWRDIKDAFSKEDAEHAAKAMTQNRDIVSRFGRFPNRNRILDRVNTAEEEEYLAEMEARRSSNLSTNSVGEAMRKGPRKQGSRRGLFRRTVKK
eukprot:m.10853 g.10853  ORF g.10853 m.10853 type:complete len:895 (+) comp2785_c0_seq1:142-2826(+)